MTISRLRATSGRIGVSAPDDEGWPDMQWPVGSPLRPADEERSIRVFAQLLSDQIHPTIALRHGRVVESTGKCLNE